MNGTFEVGRASLRLDRTEMTDPVTRLTASLPYTVAGTRTRRAVLTARLAYRVFGQVAPALATVALKTTTQDPRRPGPLATP